MRTNVALLTFLVVNAFAWPVQAWFAERHQIAAIIAAHNLTPAAHSYVAKILSVADGEDAVSSAMAAASIRPDTEFRDQDRSTASWHYPGEAGAGTRPIPSLVVIGLPMSCA